MPEAAPAQPVAAAAPLAVALAAPLPDAAAPLLDAAAPLPDAAASPAAALSFASGTFANWLTCAATKNAAVGASAQVASLASEVSRCGDGVERGVTGDITTSPDPGEPFFLSSTKSASCRFEDMTSREASKSAA